MPKRTRRMKERAALRQAAVAPASETKSVVTGSRQTLAPSTRTTYAAPSFDYSHIYSDLRRIAFFAAFFFAVLIALSFVIK